MRYPLALAAVLALRCFAHAQASDPCAQSPQTCATLINTHATSRMRIPNTVVDVFVGITVSDKDLPAVQRTLGTKSAALLKFLNAQQVQRLISNNVFFEPDSRYEKNGPIKTVGYNGVLRISFRTTPDKAADVLSGCLANGATSIDQTLFTPTEEELDAARRQLSAEATKTSVASADSIAAAAGMRVVSVRQINVSEDNFIMSSRADRFSGGGLEQVAKVRAPMPNTETSAGEESLAITVNLVAAATH